jgi:hypothetical protein
MKLFKLTHDFRWIEKIFGVRVFVMVSTFPHGYRRGEKVSPIRPDAEQINMIIPSTQRVKK